MYPPNYGDPNELNRYPASVSMAYYSSSDPTLVAAMTRDHSSSAFGGTDQSKYGRMTVDGTSPVSSHQQTQGICSDQSRGEWEEEGIHYFAALYLIVVVCVYMLAVVCILVVIVYFWLFMFTFVDHRYWSTARPAFSSHTLHELPSSLWFLSSCHVPHGCWLLCYTHCTLPSTPVKDRFLGEGGGGLDFIL